MKHLLFTFFALLAASVLVIGQQVPRDKVVIEIGTATW